MSAFARIALGLLLGTLLATIPFLHARYGLAAHEGETHAHHRH